MSEKKELRNKARQEFLDKLVKKLKKGELSWRKGWGSSFEMPFNYTTKKEYNGINKFMLSFYSYIYNFRDPRWLTFQQAKDNGFKVKDGSHGFKVEFYARRGKVEKRILTNEDIAKKKRELDKEEFLLWWQNDTYPVEKSYTVFNGEQIERIPAYEIHQISDEELAKRNERIEAIIKNSEAPVNYDGGDKAYYMPKTDSIHLPEIKNFHSMEDYYLTALHEIGHSTGHESRLKRNLANEFGSEKYAIEELVAELTSVFTAQDLKLELSENALDNNAAYIHSWVNVIHDDPNAFFDSVKEAMKASDYVLNYENTKEKQKEIQLKIIWSEHPYFKGENIILPFNEGNHILKLLDRYSLKGVGYEKTKYQVLVDGESVYEGRFDIGDGKYIPEYQENYGIVEAIDSFLNYSMKDYEKQLEKEENLERRNNLIDVINEYKKVINEFVPLIRESSEISEEFDKNLQETAYRSNYAMIEDYVEWKGGDWAVEEVSRLAEILLRYKYNASSETKIERNFKIISAKDIKAGSENYHSLVIEVDGQKLEVSNQIKGDKKESFETYFLNSLSAKAADLGITLLDKEIEEIYQAFGFEKDKKEENKQEANQASNPTNDSKNNKSEEQDSDRDKVEKVLGDSMNKWKEYYQQKREKTYANLEKNVPDEMKELKQWCAFKTFKDKETGKLKKVILNVNGGTDTKWAKCNDESTWASFDKALEYARKNECTGLSFAMKKENNISCIDLDHHIENGMRSELLWNLIKSSNSTFIEKSASSTGAHIFFKGDLGSDHVALKNDKNGIEYYRENKFISMTANMISKTNKLREVSEDFKELAIENLGIKNPFLDKKDNPIAKKRVTKSNYISMSDDEVISKISASKKGSDFDSLFAGIDICGDHSRSDFKLMNMLAFFTNCNQEQMERIFMQSGLYREKKGMSYIRRTATNAIQTLTKTPEKLSQGTIYSNEKICER